MEHAVLSDPLALNGIGGGGVRGGRTAPLVVKCFIFCLMNIKNTQVLTHRLTIRIHPYHEATTSGATINIALSF